MLALLHAGAKTFLKDASGKTVLYYALEMPTRQPNEIKTRSALVTLLSSFPELLENKKSVAACAFSFFSNKENTNAGIHLEVNFLIQEYMGADVLEEDIENLPQISQIPQKSGYAVS